MNADGFSRDRTIKHEQAERSEQQRTTRRRGKRSRRRRLFLLGAVAFLAVFIVAAPSLVSHSAAGGAIVSRAAASYGWEARVKSIRLGWITPMRVEGLEMLGTTAGTEISLQHLETEITLLQLLTSPLNNLGQITARGVVASVKIEDGHSSLEDDLQPLLTGANDSQELAADDPTAVASQAYTGKLLVQDAGLIATDAVSGRVWKMAQSNAEIDLKADGLAAQFAGVLTEPSGSGGALQGSAAWNPQPATDAPAWQLRLQCESLPISAVALAKRWLGESGQAIPAEVSGDSTGRIGVDGFADGRMTVSPEHVEVRNLSAFDPALGPQAWSNKLASFNGALVIEENRIVGRQFQVATDFASASIDGSVSTALTLSGSNDNPIAWLDALQGTAKAEVDLAMLERALPGVLPLRDGAEIVSGRVQAQVDTMPSEPGSKRCRLTLTSQPIRARTGSQNIAVEPIECTAMVTNNNGQLAADQFQLKSAFASATGKGDLRSGAADVDIDFGRLATLLSPLVDLPENSLAGIAKGNIRWNASADNMWRLDGTGQGTDVRLVLPGGQTFARPALRGEVHAVGHWDGRQLDELTEAAATIQSTGINLNAKLLAAVRSPTTETLMPIQIKGVGRVEALMDLVGPWLPAEVHDCEGGFDLLAKGDVSAASGRITNVTLELLDPNGGYHDYYIAQPTMKVLFDGDYSWPAGDLVARSCTIASDAMSAAMQGEMTSQKTELQVAWRTKLDRLQNSLRTRLANRDGKSIQPAGYRIDTSADNASYQYKGDFEGKLAIVNQDGGWLAIDCESLGKNISIVQPPATTPGAPQTSQVVWAEPNFKLDGKLRYRASSGEVEAENLQVAGDWFAATLAGQAVSGPTLTSVQLNGPGRLKMDEIAQRLSELAGTKILATGIHETPLDIKIQQKPDGSMSMNIVCSLGWEAAESGGIVLGQTSIPIHMTETTVTISPSVVPLAQGKLNLAGEVHYSPGPIWLRVEPGRVAESIRLTRQMNEQWLKYLAPLAADAAQIDGTLGITLDEATIVLDAPQQNRVVGQLDIAGVEMTAGPLSNQIITGVQQLKAIAKSQTPTTPAEPPTEKALVTMPAQIVDFSLIDGVVSHQRLTFQIDRAQVITSGQVTQAGDLKMIAQVPLDARWFGNDLKGLAGQSVNLPIDGTLSRPRLDAAGVRQVVAQLGVQAIQGAADNYLQQQLNKGLGKLFGK